MTNSLPEAVLQRDGKTYAIVTRIPAGIITPGQLETIARVGTKYRIPVLKITSGLRVILAGIQPDDLPGVCHDLGPLAKPGTPPCVSLRPRLPRHGYVQIRKTGLDRACQSYRGTIQHQVLPGKDQNRNLRLPPLLQREPYKGYRDNRDFERLDGVLWR